MPHLLLVDDEEALRSVVAERLRDAGYEVTEAADGEAAVRAIDGFAFDVIVSDLRLPGVDGREVIETALTRYPSIVAIVVTGYGTVKDAVDMTKMGVAISSRKPFQFDELMHVLNSALEQRRLQERERVLTSTARRAIRPRRDDRQERADARALPVDRNGRAVRGHDPHHRRDRHRQGNGRARDPSNQPASSRPLRRHQRQRDS
jgi:DNA-binding NtrC family response regulator